MCFCSWNKKILLTFIHHIEVIAVHLSGDDIGTLFRAFIDSCVIVTEWFAGCPFVCDNLCDRLPVPNDDGGLKFVFAIFFFVTDCESLGTLQYRHKESTNRMLYVKDYYLIKIYYAKMSDVHRKDSATANKWSEKIAFPSRTWIWIYQKLLHTHFGKFTDYQIHLHYWRGSKN